ncbi:MAG: hypothetical protein PBU97_12075 [Stenotrophomonas maltophilia]
MASTTARSISSVTVPAPRCPAGVASYTVAGLNKFNGSNLLSGTFDADFGAGTLDGALTGGGLTLAIS